MITEARKPRRRKNRKQQNKTATAWSAAVAIVIVAVLGYLVVQAQRHLATVQGELHKLREAALQSEAKIVDLEQISATWQRALEQADSKRNELQDQLNTANSEIERLRHLVEAAGASRRDWQTRLEKMRSELANTKQSQGQAKAEAAELTEQVSSLNVQLNETIAERQALGTKLQSAQAEVEQLRSELKAAEIRLRLPPSKNLEDASGKSGQLGAPKPAKRPDPQTKTLKKASRHDITPPTEQARIPHGDNYEERDYLIRTVVFEASGETEIGKAAVAHVILNRKRIGRWGDRIQEVVTHPWQFEPWMTRKNEIAKLSANDPRYLDAAKIADAVLGGHIPDPTTGATHFLNPVIVRQRRGGSLPSWAVGDGQPIGRHVFYFPERDGPAPQRAEVHGLQPISSLRHSSPFPGAG